MHAQPTNRVQLGSGADGPGAVAGAWLDEGAFLHLFDWKKQMAYFIGHKGAEKPKSFEVRSFVRSFVRAWVREYVRLVVRWVGSRQ